MVENDINLLCSSAARSAWQLEDNV